jgi:murein DD-endopeptidase MepM/ murein hydrolase activator NlpD
MRILFICLFFSSTFYGFCQTENESYKTVSANFERFYNSKNGEAIFNLFSSEMKAALPKDQTKEFINTLSRDYGKITSREFIGYENASYATYKTQFEKIVFQLNISIDTDNNINGLFIKPFKEDTSLKLEKNISSLILPFKEEWTVFWGGDTKELNYHVKDRAQKHAFDLVITDSLGKSYKTNGITNEDYYAFGKEIIAPCDAEVVLAVDGIKDNSPGEMNPIYIPGNTVILKTELNEYIFFAHFKQHSVAVKEGQKIKQGDLLGLCGNSGNSSEAHLHFHIQNIEDLSKAIGVKCFFDTILVNDELKKNYSPIQDDKIKNK